jgi:hypothetical protein
MTGQMLPPFWVVGSPRSGTTFLAKVLDQHPEVFLTNETRVMLLVSRLLNRHTTQRRLLATNKDVIVETLWREVPRLVEQMYIDQGAEPGMRWGDKYPQYVDGNHDPEAIATIDRLFPEGQYIHIIRDPRAAVGSIKEKGWQSLEGSVLAWRNHVAHGRDFGLSIGLDRYHELRYEDLVSDGQAAVRSIFDFLGLAWDEDVEAYIAAEEAERSPVSYPIGRPGAIGSEAWVDRLDADELHYVESELVDMMTEFGYEPIAT